MLDWLLSVDRSPLIARGLLLGALLSTPALASPSEETPESRLVAAVHEALAVERLAAEKPASTVGSGGVRVYLGMETEDLVLQEATLTVADRDPTRIELGHRGALALQGGGMLRLHDAWEGSGSVALRVEVLARQDGAGMSAHMVRLALETDYAPETEPLGLRVAVARDGVFRRHTLQRREWSAQQ